MKKKHLSTHRQSKSPKQKARQLECSDELMHNFIGLLTEKVDQMQSMIGDIPLSPSIHPGNDTLDPSTSTEKKIESPLNEQNFLPDDFDPDELRFQASESSATTASGTINTTGRLGTSSGQSFGTSGGVANSGQSAAAIAHRTAFDYAPQQTTTYCYGFTNSEFFAFIGSLDPVEYILVITVIAIIIGVELNVFERQIVGGALVDIGVTLGNMVEQELFQTARQNEAASRQRNEAEQTDFDNLYNDIDVLQAEIDAIKQQLGMNQT
ncbi:hypothetical protein [Turicibacter sp. H121]|uniref:hypothetical protein n=1 Tax=Turicibacter sp. H121 TaxID=1712675 RepID=UPI0007630C2A|nr:hypothetical protein [Turicibacter sp. H121]AMC08046.1 hypothetical protein AT726_03180 [Turicibacter sp. H121]MCU7200282.1 hypothetical protein [Turicibacter sp. H121]